MGIASIVSSCPKQFYIYGIFKISENCFVLEALVKFINIEMCFLHDRNCNKISGIKKFLTFS